MESSPSELGCPFDCDHKRDVGFSWRRPSTSVDSNDVDEEDKLGLMSSESDSTQEEVNFIKSSYDHASSSSSSSSHTRGHALCHRGLSSVYQPKVFEDIVGHDVIIRALSNAIRWKRIVPLYLFHGPGGTGKTSAARIFAMALNCESSAALLLKPCWACTGCSHSLYTAELCSGNKNLCFEKIRSFLQSTTQTENSSNTKVFIIDIDLYSAAETWPWGELLNLAQQLEDERGGAVVIILITEDASAVPRAVSSRCQKFNFHKLRHTDVLLKLSRIVAQGGIKIRKSALKLISRKTDGNLREAENLLDQLALLGLKVDTSMIQQFVSIAFWLHL